MSVIIQGRGEPRDIMRVLFQIRPDYLTNMAGDSIQMLKTRQYLERLGVRVDVSTTLTDLRPYDLVHLFNTTRVRETYIFLRQARQQGKPVAVSTIYWDAAEFLARTGSSSGATTAWASAHRLRRRVFQEATILLPNAREEMELISRQFGPVAPHHIVPNGVEEFFAHARPDAFTRTYGLRNFILCVGRIAPRKNQLTLAEALRDTGLTLVLLGPVNDASYAAQCAAAGSHVIMLPFMEHHRLAAAYAAAAVHVLPGWFETPGLANLEAGLAGCRVVSTDRGTAKEYFGHLALYCQPDDPSSIRRAVMDALQSPPNYRLKEHIQRHFTWQRVAEETLIAYQKCLCGK
ncbi:glycosyltransferase family 4 protein [Desulfofundulus sp. TPOSR]|nr:glycosyltransferase family 4 protein [Desulfofundulus sp. TPOSR]